MISEVFNTDCLPSMREMPDKAFDLAIVDPPYGIGAALVTGGRNEGGAFSNMTASYADLWDVPPSQEYFNQLFRVSVNQIIWGANYFTLPPCRQPICWDKVRPNQKNAGEWEYAWTSFTGRARMFSHCNNAGFIIPTPRIHPTQKPIKLYKWLLTNYAKPGQTILDTHGGSFSSRIACWDLGFDFTGFESDPDYFAAAEKRFADHIAQPKLFAPEPVIETQGVLI